MSIATDTGSVTCVTDSGHHAAVHRLHGGSTVAWIVRAVHPATGEVRYFGPFRDVPTTRKWVERHLGAVVMTTDAKSELAE